MADKPDKKEKKEAVAAEPAGEAAAPKTKKEKKAAEGKEKKGDKPAPKKSADYGPDFKYIVRIENTDLDGTKPVALALTGIKGIGHHVAAIVADIASVPRGSRIGKLSDADIEKLAVAVTDLDSTLPPWMVNRPKDVETGEYIHLLRTDLDGQLREDLNRLKMIRSYRGVRHESGQKVRGQRTRSSGRVGMAMGVQRSKEAMAQAAAKKDEKD